MRQFALTILVVAGGWGAFSATTQAQVMNPTATPNVVQNLYGNSLTNPYLNPGATLNPVNRTDSLLYLWAAQNAQGGLLNNNLTNQRQAANMARAAEMPRTAMTPGGSANHYFGRGTRKPNPAMGRYYQRSNRYFGNNGR